MPKPPIKPPHKGPPRSGKPGKDAAPAKIEAPVRKERIAKRLARAGVASRREVERLIGLGKVAVNGKILDTPATLVTRDDVITVDGKPIGAAQATRVWRYHKPVGLLTSHRDPSGRPTVFDSLPSYLPRVISVGRLDINTEGLLLLTNDGELSRALELPATAWVRQYRARARGRVTQEQLDGLKDGVTVDGVRYGPVEATLDKAKEGEGGDRPTRDFRPREDGDRPNHAFKPRGDAPARAEGDRPKRDFKPRGEGRPSGGRPGGKPGGFKGGGKPGGPPRGGPRKPR